MEFKNREFVPVIFGGDINTYSVARAFYEEYQVQTYVFGKYLSGPSYESRITIYQADPQIETDEKVIAALNGLAEKFPDKRVIAFGAGDTYINLLSKNKKQLKENVIVPYIDFEMMDRLQRKDFFYDLCEKNGVDYPDTIVYTPDMGLDFAMEFSYPVILKPSESVTYWHHPFEGQEKIFYIQNRKELEAAIQKTYEAGYESPMIIQDTIPGSDESMYVLTSYSNREGQVVMMCLGHVLLEEHGPIARGNHALIITEENETLMKQAKKLLEDMHYVGFSNFDIKYDSRDGKYKFFEINTRQGRSNYYVTGSGFNVARYVVEDYIYQKEQPLKLSKDPHLWMVIPRKVAFRYVKEEKNKEAMRRLIREKKVVNPVFMKGDGKLSRLYRLFRTHMSHFVKYKKYYS
ncbi:ATP-grasp domain-containing protein [Clostridiaceae bacterium 68-1-5]|uniref:ATP-grasp domain-containing protein n=1 Tax=Suipraeoptans intestinalis TaxID=2606628 RepID=A0A6N7UTK4_9FIRM|nr:ATP-grasp domain-containing protein [Suipraeoptans intestinalis]MSR94404.1 ATP-grasp domain-containing protein [Suipraeoptans intestinalis]